MRRLRSLHERTTTNDSSTVASDIEDHVEQAVQLTRSLYKGGVPEEVKSAALALEHALSEVAKNEVVKLLRAAQG
jgi:t-SNARE complex subunit (syntaxin)